MYTYLYNKPFRMLIAISNTLATPQIAHVLYISEMLAECFIWKASVVHKQLKNVFKKIAVLRVF